MAPDKPSAFSKQDDCPPARQRLPRPLESRSHFRKGLKDQDRNSYKWAPNGAWSGHTGACWPHSSHYTPSFCDLGQVTDPPVAQIHLLLSLIVPSPAWLWTERWGHKEKVAALAPVLRGSRAWLSRETNYARHHRRFDGGSAGSQGNV